MHICVYAYMCIVGFTPVPLSRHTLYTRTRGLYELLHRVHDCLPPSDTSPHQNRQPPAAHHRRHSRPHHRRRGEHSPTARQPHSSGLTLRLRLHHRQRLRGLTQLYISVKLDRPENQSGHPYSDGCHRHKTRNSAVGAPG